jgi:tetratricopeptide (TPR) repeat protein
VSLKQYEDSRQIFLEALAMRKDEAKYLVLPVDIQKSNIKIAKALNNIGCVYYEMGNFDQGILMIEASIRMQQNTAGEPSIFNFTDPTKKPGFLTMASTMCNKGERFCNLSKSSSRNCYTNNFALCTGYIHLEQHDFSRAIRIFNASLDIQKYLLGADNNLILSTLDNLAFAYLAFSSYDAALSTYEKLIFNQENSYSVTSFDCASTLKNIVYVQLIQSKFEDALKTLCQLEDIQCDALSPDSKHLRETRRLMGQTNFQVMKHPGLACFSCEGADEPMDITKWRPKKPINGSKMSGHRVSCA